MAQEQSSLVSQQPAKLTPLERKAQRQAKKEARWQQKIDQKRQNLQGDPDALKRYDEQLKERTMKHLALYEAKKYHDTRVSEVSQESRLKGLAYGIATNFVETFGAEKLRARRLSKAMRENGVSVTTNEFVRAAAQVAIKSETREARRQEIQRTVGEAKKRTDAQDLIRNLAGGKENIDRTVNQFGQKPIEAICQEIIVPMLTGGVLTADGETAAWEKIQREFGNNPAINGLTKEQVIASFRTLAQVMQERGVVASDPRKLEAAFDSMIYRGKDAYQLEQLAKVSKMDFITKSPYAKGIVLGALGVTMAANFPVALAVGAGFTLVTSIHKLNVDRAMRAIEAQRGQVNIRAKKDISAEHGVLNKLMAMQGNLMNVDWEQAGMGRNWDYANALIGRVGIGAVFSSVFYGGGRLLGGLGEAGHAVPHTQAPEQSAHTTIAAIAGPDKNTAGGTSADTALGATKGVGGDASNVVSRADMSPLDAVHAVHGSNPVNESNLTPQQAAEILKMIDHTPPQPGGSFGEEIRKQIEQAIANSKNGAPTADDFKKILESAFGHGREKDIQEEIRAMVEKSGNPNHHYTQQEMDQIIRRLAEANPTKDTLPQPVDPDKVLTAFQHAVATKDYTGAAKDLDELYKLVGQDPKLNADYVQLVKDLGSPQGFAADLAKFHADILAEQHQQVANEIQLDISKLISDHTQELHGAHNGALVNADLTKLHHDIMQLPEPQRSDALANYSLLTKQLNNPSGFQQALDGLHKDLAPFEPKTSPGNPFDNPPGDPAALARAAQDQHYVGQDLQRAFGQDGRPANPLFLGKAVGDEIHAGWDRVEDGFAHIGKAWDEVTGANKGSNAGDHASHGGSAASAGAGVPPTVTPEASHGGGMTILDTLHSHLPAHGNEAYGMNDQIVHVQGGFGLKLNPYDVDGHTPNMIYHTDASGHTIAFEIHKGTTITDVGQNVNVKDQIIYVDGQREVVSMHDVANIFGIHSGGLGHAYNMGIHESTDFFHYKGELENFRFGVLQGDKHTILDMGQVRGNSDPSHQGFENFLKLHPGGNKTPDADDLSGGDVHTGLAGWLEENVVDRIQAFQDHPGISTYAALVAAWGIGSGVVGYRTWSRQNPLPPRLRDIVGLTAVTAGSVSIVGFGVGLPAYIAGGLIGAFIRDRRAGHTGGQANAANNQQGGNPPAGGGGAGGGGGGAAPAAGRGPGWWQRFRNRGNPPPPGTPPPGGGRGATPIAYVAPAVLAGLAPTVLGRIRPPTPPGAPPAPTARATKDADNLAQQLGNGLTGKQVEAARYAGGLATSGSPDEIAKAVTEMMGLQDDQGKLDLSNKSHAELLARAMGVSSEDEVRKVRDGIQRAYYANQAANEYEAANPVRKNPAERVEAMLKAMAEHDPAIHLQSGETPKTNAAIALMEVLILSKLLEELASRNAGSGSKQEIFRAMQNQGYSDGAKAAAIAAFSAAPMAQDRVKEAFNRLGIFSNSSSVDKDKVAEIAAGLSTAFKEISGSLVGTPNIIGATDNDRVNNILSAIDSLAKPDDYALKGLMRAVLSESIGENLQAQLSKVRDYKNDPAVASAITPTILQSIKAELQAFGFDTVEIDRALGVMTPGNVEKAVQAALAAGGTNAEQLDAAFGTLNKTDPNFADDIARVVLNLRTSIAGLQNTEVQSAIESLNLPDATKVNITQRVLALAVDSVRGVPVGSRTPTDAELENALKFALATSGVPDQQGRTLSGTDPVVQTISKIITAVLVYNGGAPTTPGYTAPTHPVVPNVPKVVNEMWHLDTQGTAEVAKTLVSSGQPREVILGELLNTIVDPAMPVTEMASVWEAIKSSLPATGGSATAIEAVCTAMGVKTADLQKRSAIYSEFILPTHPATGSNEAVTHLLTNASSAPNIVSVVQGLILTHQPGREIAQAIQALGATVTKTDIAIAGLRASATPEEQAKLAILAAAPNATYTEARDVVEELQGQSVNDKIIRTTMESLGFGQNDRLQIINDALTDNIDNIVKYIPPTTGTKPKPSNEGDLVKDINTYVKQSMTIAGYPDLPSHPPARPALVAKIKAVLLANATRLNLPTITISGVTSPDPAFIDSLIRQALRGVE